MKDSLARNAIVKAVVNSVGAVRPDVGVLDDKTHLLGANAVLDSVGFVTLLIALEGHFGNAIDLSASFMEQNDVEDQAHPFSTVGLLADHIAGLLSRH